MNIRFSLLKCRYCLTITRRYCGAIATSRRPRPGENWLRGRDLKDGKLRVLPSVLWDIVCYELGMGRWRVPARRAF